jgi:laminin alpha 3/5
VICPCRTNVHGRHCDQCKDGYFGLSKDNLLGCSLCQCSRDGSLNELELCEQNGGQCHCKQLVSSVSCSECKSGSFKLERNNIFGCQECGCHIGSSVDNNCDTQTGQCQCLPNIVGEKCDRLAEGFYLPDMHQLKFEIEDGFTKNGKAVRYDFNETIYPNYSWKGYVHLNKIVGRVTQNINIKKRGTYRMIINYMNMNTNMSKLFVKVNSLDPNIDEQNAIVVKYEKNYFKNNSILYFNK